MKKYLDEQELIDALQKLHQTNNQNIRPLVNTVKSITNKETINKEKIISNKQTINKEKVITKKETIDEKTITKNVVNEKVKNSNTKLTTTKIISSVMNQPQHKIKKHIIKRSENSFNIQIKKNSGHNKNNTQQINAKLIDDNDIKNLFT